MVTSSNITLIFRTNLWKSMAMHCVLNVHNFLRLIDQATFGRKLACFRIWNKRALTANVNFHLYMHLIVCESQKSDLFHRGLVKLPSRDQVRPSLNGRCVRPKPLLRAWTNNLGGLPCTFSPSSITANFCFTLLGDALVWLTYPAVHHFHANKGRVVGHKWLRLDLMAKHKPQCQFKLRSYTPFHLHDLKMSAFNAHRSMPTHTIFVHYSSHLRSNADCA